MQLYNLKCAGKCRFFFSRQQSDNAQLSSLDAHMIIFFSRGNREKRGAALNVQKLRHMYLVPLARCCKFPCHSMIALSRAVVHIPTECTLHMVLGDSKLVTAAYNLAKLMFVSTETSNLNGMKNSQNIGLVSQGVDLRLTHGEY